MTIIKYIKFVVIIVIVTIVFPCSKNEAGNSEYDPSLPISLTDFFPIQGGMATRMVIEGANFGTDLSQIKVFFNQKEASILNVKNTMEHAWQSNCRNRLTNLMSDDYAGDKKEGKWNIKTQGAFVEIFSLIGELEQLGCFQE